MSVTERCLSALMQLPSIILPRVSVSWKPYMTDTIDNDCKSLNYCKKEVTPKSRKIISFTISMICILQ